MEHLKSFFSQACKLILVLLAGVLLGILMHMEYLKQQRQILECFMYRLGNTLSVNLESCYQDVLDDFIRIKETEKAKNREKE